MYLVINYGSVDHQRYAYACNVITRRVVAKHKFLSTADVSKVLGVTPAGVRLMVQTRRLKVAAETEGGIRLFKRADVEKVLARREAERKRLNQWTHVRTDADA